MSKDEPIAEYVPNETERRIVFRHQDRTVSIVQPTQGYGMLIVRSPEGGEHERYYGLDMAIDHAAELLGVSPQALPLPDLAADMGI